MAVNLSALSPFQTQATALSNLILVTPNSNLGYQPQQKIFPDGSVSVKDPAVLFDYEGEQEAQFESDITDHFVEDNTAINDQIALMPEIITTRGYIGELNDVTPPLLQTLRAAADKLSVIDSYTPGLSVTALLAYQEAFQAYQLASLAASAGVAAWQSLSGGQSQNKQQIAFSRFYGYWQNRTLFTIQTPWAIFNNMAIKSLIPVQNADTELYSEFQVVFKKMRFAETISTSGLALKFQGRSANDASLGVNTGSSTGTPATFSLLQGVGGL